MKNFISITIVSSITCLIGYAVGHNTLKKENELLRDCVKQSKDMILDLVCNEAKTE